MLRVGELAEQGMLIVSNRPRNALRLKGLVPLASRVTAGAAGTAIASPSMMKLRALTAAIAAPAAGNRSVKSVPRRLNSLTFSPPRVAMMR